MRTCIEDNCPAEGLELPKWMHVCPVCGWTTYDLEEIKRAMEEPGTQIELVDREDLVNLIELLGSNQENWDDEDFEFIEKMREKYLGD